MQRVLIEVWLDETETVNDRNVGRALGEALMMNDVKYATEDYFRREIIRSLEENREKE